MPPLVIRKFSSIAIQTLFLAIFKCLRRDFEKLARD